MTYKYPYKEAIVCAFMIIIPVILILFYTSCSFSKGQTEKKRIYQVYISGLGRVSCTEKYDVNYKYILENCTGVDGTKEVLNATNIMVIYE